MSHRLEGDGSLVYTINLCWNSVTIYLCMPPDMFDELLPRVGQRIIKTHTRHREPLEPL